MQINKALFLSQEITPYLPETTMSVLGRNVPQSLQEKGIEVRTFMPKYGKINERRNQLHEVIRLSGLNIVIDDTEPDTWAHNIFTFDNQIGEFGGATVTVTENGYGKRTDFEEFRVKGRGGLGVTCHNLTEKTGLLCGIAAVDDGYDLMMITDGGTIIRTPVKDVNTYSRAASGVIVMRPKILVLDEPTAMLDPQGRKDVMQIIKKLHEGGTTVVLITHFMDEAAQAQRVVVMNDGQILIDGTPHYVFENAGLLRSVGLDVPQSTDLMFLLRRHGLRVPLSVLTEDECVKVLRDVLDGKYEVRQDVR